MVQLSFVTFILGILHSKFETHAGMHCICSSKNASLLHIQEVLWSNCTKTHNNLFTCETTSVSSDLAIKTKSAVFKCLLLERALTAGENCTDSKKKKQTEFFPSDKTFLVLVLSVFARTSWNHHRRIKCVSLWSSRNLVKRQRWVVCLRMTGS